MSVLTCRISIRHDGQAVAGFPMTRRVESADQEGMLVDQQWPDTDSQAPGDAGGTNTAFSALHFEKAATLQLSTYTGTRTWDMGANAIIIIMNTETVSFTPAANSRIRGVV